MKIFLALIVINFIAVGDSSIKESDGTVYKSYQIEYDSKLRRYELVHRPNCDCDRLYEINNKNKIVSENEFFHIWKILINKQDHVFVFVSDQDKHKEGKQSLWRFFPENFDHIDNLFTFYAKGKYNDLSYFIDKDDIIYFNTQAGVAALKPNKTRPVWIENLENFNFDQHEEDGYGNVYLGNSIKNSVAVITKETKRWSILTGKFIPLENDRESSKDPILVDEKIPLEKESGLTSVHKTLIAIAVIVVILFLIYFAATRKLRNRNRRSNVSEQERKRKSSGNDSDSDHGNKPVARSISLPDLSVDQSTSQEEHLKTNKSIETGNLSSIKYVPGRALGDAREGNFRSILPSVMMPDRDSDSDRNFGGGGGYNFGGGRYFGGYKFGGGGRSSGGGGGYGDFFGDD